LMTMPRRGNLAWSETLMPHMPCTYDTYM
jgi:hypothetical protein